MGFAAIKKSGFRAIKKGGFAPTSKSPNNKAINVLSLFDGMSYGLIALDRAAFLLLITTRAN